VDNLNFMISVIRSNDAQRAEISIGVKKCTIIPSISTYDIVQLQDWLNSIRSVRVSLMTFIFRCYLARRGEIDAKFRCQI
jgi:hypothetical protein